VRAAPRGTSFLTPTGALWFTCWIAMGLFTCVELIVGRALRHQLPIRLARLCCACEFFRPLLQRRGGRIRVVLRVRLPGVVLRRESAVVLGRRRSSKTRLSRPRRATRTESALVDRPERAGNDYLSRMSVRRDSAPATLSGRRRGCRQSPESVVPLRGFVGGDRAR